MSTQRIPGPLVVRPWIDHSATTIGYIERKDRFIALADCSIGPDFAVTHEPLARLLAAAPELLDALQKIALGNWNFGNTEPGLSVMEFAARAVAKATGQQGDAA